MKKLGSSYAIMIIVLGSITITTVLADTVTITTYPYTIQDGSNNQRLVITSSGNVGIGTTSPTYSLDVSGSNGNGIRFTDTTNGVQTFVGAYTSRGIVGTLDNAPLTLWSNNAEKVRIDTSGNIGIGTTSPTYSLDVSGSNGNGIRFTDTTNGVQTFVGAYTSRGIVGTLDNAPLTLWSNNAEKVRIDTSGNVGIGTTSPTQKLDVIGNIRLTGNIVSPNDICIGTC